MQEMKRIEGLGFVVENLLKDTNESDTNESDTNEYSQRDKKYDEIKQNILAIFNKIKQTFKKLNFYDKIFTNDKLICKIDKYKISTFPKIFIDDLGIAFDNHNEALIQYIIYTYRATV